MMRLWQVPITADAVGAGTATTRPMTGHVVSVRNNGTAFGSTADWTLTRVDDGGTVLAATNAVGPWQYQPRDTLHTVTGGSALAAAGDPGIPIAGPLRITVAQATPSASGVINVYVLED